MNKREKMNLAKMVQTAMFVLSEMPKSAREDAQKQGYRYLRITVEDVDSGKRVMPPMYTIRKPDDLPHLERTEVTDNTLITIPRFTIRKASEMGSLYVSLLKIADWPGEYLEQLKTPLYVDGQVWVDETKTARQISDKQLSSGRGKSPMWQGYYGQWKDSGYDRTVKRRLKEAYSEKCPDKELGQEKFERTLKRLKQEDNRGVIKSR